MIRLTTKDVFPVSRLYEDDLHAFIGGSVQYNEESRSFDWSDIEASDSLFSPKPQTDINFRVRLLYHPDYMAEHRAPNRSLV